MKKYITAAALLAAGSAFANANVILPGEDDLLFKFTYSEDSDTPQYNETAWTWTHWGTEVPSIADGVAKFSTGGPYTESGVSFNPGEFTVSFDIKEVSNTSDGVVLAYGNGAKGDNFFAVTVTSSSITLLNTVPATCPDWYNLTGMETILTAEGLDLSGSEFQSVTVSNVAGQVFIALDNVVVAKTTTVSISENANASAHFGIGSVFGGGLGKLNGTLDNVAFYGVASTIPEPSAFGMLAGLGALALVASRRRRK